MTRPDQSEGDRARDEVLAGEYVLGVLSSEARAKVAARIRSDRSFAAIVARWEQNLAELDQEYETVAPPNFILPLIETRLFGVGAGRSRAMSGSGVMAGLWGSVTLWRSLALMSIFLLVGTALFAERPETPGGGRAPLLAQMQGQNDAALSLVAHYTTGDGRLRLTPVANAAAEPHSLELWMIHGSDPAVSLGVIPQSGDGAVVVPDSLRPVLGDGVTLAVSLEPLGGSPTGVATGPVLAAGPLRRP
jgi:anti-sigma-K factor RskA